MGADFTETCKKIFFILIALLSAAYYALCVSYAHAGVSWLWIWPLLSLLCIVRFLMLHFRLRIPKWISLIYHLLALCFAVLFAVIEGRIILSMNISPAPELDYIITLGAAVRDGLPTSPLKLRIDTSAEYLLENPDTVAIASGGQGPGESMSEAACIKKYLLESGIAEERILLEERSTDTEQNIEYSFEMIPPGAKVGIVTSSFHIYRALRLAELAGHHPYAVPAPALLPLGIHYTVREFFAVVELEAKNLLNKTVAAGALSC